jgi:D-alanyl-D-alanine carboxypeptidase
MTKIGVSDSELRQRFQRILDEHVFQGIIGATMGVSVPGFGDMVYASGMAEVKKSIPMNPEHMLMIASNTKTFVAAVILQLVQEGKIDLDETIDRWFPRLPNARFITVRQVITHESGIPDRNTHCVEETPPSDSVWMPEDILELAYNSSPTQPPGQYNYSNTNYIVLALIIEKETDESRAAQVRKRLLEPFCLEDTYTATDEEYPQERLAHGYAHGTAELEDVTHRYPVSLSGPAGDMISTVRDLLSWLRAVFSGKVIKEPYLRLFSTRQVAGTYPGTSMSGHGLGSMIHTYNDLEVVGYRGAIQGYISIMARELERGISAVILTNSYHENRNSYYVAGIDRPFESVFRTALAALRS